MNINKYSQGWNSKKHKQVVNRRTHLRPVRIPLNIDAILEREAQQHGGITAVIILALKKFLKIKN